MVEVRHPLVGWSILISTGFFLGLFSRETDRKLIRADDDFRETLWMFSESHGVSRPLSLDPTVGGRPGFSFTFSRPRTARLFANILTVFQE